MTCKRSEQCDHADLCRFAKNTDYNLLGGSCFEPKDPQTNEEWLRSATTEQLIRFLLWYPYNVHGYPKPKMNIAEEEDAIREWLKQPHRGGS